MGVVNLVGERGVRSCCAGRGEGLKVVHLTAGGVGLGISQDSSLWVARPKQHRTLTFFRPHP